jgi:hypothetical protein
VLPERAGDVRCQHGGHEQEDSPYTDVSTESKNKKRKTYKSTPS